MGKPLGLIGKYRWSQHFLLVKKLLTPLLIFKNHHMELIEVLNTLYWLWPSLFFVLHIFESGKNYHSIFCHQYQHVRRAVYILNHNRKLIPRFCISCVSPKNQSKLEVPCNILQQVVLAPCPTPRWETSPFWQSTHPYSTYL